MTAADRRSTLLARTVAALATAVAALGLWSALQYRSDDPWLLRWSWRFWAVGLLPAAMLPAALPLTLRRGGWALAAAAGAAGLAAAGLNPDPRSSVAAGLLALLLLLHAAARRFRTPGPYLSALVLALFGAVLAAAELPVLRHHHELVRWGRDDCFRQPLFPKAPPYLPAGGRLLPDLDARLPAPEYPTGARLITNALGLRTAHAVTPGAAPVVRRVLLLGDSFANGFAADQDAFFAPLLERELGGAERVEVLPVEVSDPAYGLRHLQDHIAALRPDLVLYGHCGNDVMQAGWYAGPGGPFRLHPGGVLRDDGPRLADADFYRLHDDLVYSRPGRPPAAPARPGLAARLARFRLFHGLAARRGDAAVATAGFAPQPEGDRRLRLLDGAANLGLYLRDEPPRLRAMLDVTASLYAAMDSTAAAAGAGFAVVLFPQRHQVQPRDWAAMREAWNLDDADFDLDRPQTVLRDAGERCGFRVLDLLPDFRAAAPATPQLYLPGGDVHFNRHGHALAARSAARLLRTP